MKKLMIAGVILLSIGIGVSLLALSAMGWDFTKLDTGEPFEKRELTVENLHQNITLDDRNTDVQVITSADEKIHFTYYENSHVKYDIEKTDGMTFTKVNSGKWYDFFRFHLKSSVFTVQLPKGYKGNLLLQTSNKMVKVENITTNQLQAITSNGLIDLKQVEARRIKAMTANGKIQADNLQVEGKILLETSNNPIIVERSTAGELHVDTDNGKILLHKVKIAGDVDLETSNASIEIKDLDFAGDAEIETHNGSIKGNIVGIISDFSITSKTSNGSNNLPIQQKTTSQKLEVETSNGDIFIEFTP